MEYTEKQQHAIDLAVKNINQGERLTTISGAAGTGKSTIMKEILARTSGIVACAYTGKAANVLRNKGISATTIHQRIYQWNEKYQTFDRLWDVPYKGFAIDEGSMVGVDIFKDLQSYNFPILAIGDPYQLEPIGKDAHLMKDADYELTEIHRQAADNPIIDLATRVRLGEPWGVQDTPGCVVTKGKPKIEDVFDYDIVLCGFNKTRVGINTKFRAKLGYKKIVEVGDKLVVLSNDKDLCVFNGQSCVVKAVGNITERFVKATLMFDNGLERIMNLSTKGFNNTSNAKWDFLKTIKGHAVYIDYAYALTTHKAQGSEYDKVAVIDEQWSQGWEPARWRYTAYSRAAKELNVFL